MQELALPVLHIHVLCRAQVDRGTPAPTLSPTCRQPRFHWRSPLVTTTVPRLSGESTGLAELVEQRARVSAQFPPSRDGRMPPNARNSATSATAWVPEGLLQNPPVPATEIVAFESATDS